MHEGYCLSTCKQAFSLFLLQFFPKRAKNQNQLDNYEAQTRKPHMYTSVIIYKKKKKIEYNHMCVRHIFTLKQT